MAITKTLQLEVGVQSVPLAVGEYVTKESRFWVLIDWVVYKSVKAVEIHYSTNKITGHHAHVGRILWITEMLHKTS